MTVNEYISAGFNLSTQISQQVITAAEVDVFDAYVKPIIGAEADKDDFKSEIMALAFCLMLRRNVVKTRFGSETKNNQYATVMQFESGQLQNQIYGHCQPAYKSLKSRSTLTEPCTSVTDIIDSGFYSI